MKIRTVCIDDNPYVIESTKKLIDRYNIDLEFAGEADSVLSGVKLINTVNPDLILLDIELQGGTGFDILECFPEYNFNVIFVTAYNQYALEAFKFSALAYITKPLKKQDLINAVDKVKNKKLEIASYHNFLENLRAKRPFKIEIRSSDGIMYIDINSIIHLDSDGRYSVIYTDDDNRYFVTKNLGDFESFLTDYGFFRIHKSHIVNLSHVKQILYKDGGFIRMTNGANLSISRTKKDTLQKEMKKLSR